MREIDHASAREVSELLDSASIKHLIVALIIVLLRSGVLDNRAFLREVQEQITEHA